MPWLDSVEKKRRSRFYLAVNTNLYRTLLTGNKTLTKSSRVSVSTFTQRPTLRLCGVGTPSPCHPPIFQLITWGHSCPALMVPMRRQLLRYWQTKKFSFLCDQESSKWDQNLPAKCFCKWHTKIRCVIPSLQWFKPNHMQWNAYHCHLNMMNDDEQCQGQKRWEGHYGPQTGTESCLKDFISKDCKKQLVGDVIALSRKWRAGIRF